jgi:AraC-like DNA-binding protein
LKEAAAATNMSRAHLAYLFKKQVGLSPIAFQKQVRITRTKQMLSMPLLPIKEIAVVLGFKNPDHFSSCFRKVVGVSPRQYRMNR